MSADTNALCVRVLWFDVRVATHLVRDGATLSLNQSGDAVARTHAPLHFDARTFTFHEGVAGTVWRNGETALSLGDAVHRGLAAEDGSAWKLTLGRSDVVRVGRGPLRVEAFRTQAPRRFAAVRAHDYAFLNSLLVCLAVFFLFATQAAFTNSQEDGDTAPKAPTQLTRHLVKPQTAPPPPTKTARDTTQQPQKQRASAGRPKPPNVAQRNTGGVDARDLVGRIFSGRGPGGVFGPGGIGRELSGALGNVVAVNGDGNGGWSIKGDGGGGSRDGTIQIGGIARSGIEGRPVPGLSKKDTIEPDYERGPPVLCSGGGCMDKELIRKVIASHRDQVRYCYEYALQSSPALGGKVAVSFVVSDSGAVSAAAIADSSANNTTLEACLTSRVRTWQFPVGKGGGGYRVTYPFVFKRA